MKKLMVLCLLVFCLNVNATITGNQLLNFCKGNINTVVGMAGKSFCTGYVNGFVDSYATASDLHSYPEKLFCLPPRGITNDQAMSIVTHYLENHQHDLHLSARSLVTSAFVLAYPCIKS